MEQQSPVSDDLGPTDQELFSLYIKYPEMNFDTEEDDRLADLDSDQSDEIHSSPTTVSTTVTISTVRTTPPRLDPRLGPNIAHEELQMFRNLLVGSDLPKETVEFLSGLANRTLNISATLFPSREELFGPEEIEGLLRISQEMATLLRCSIRNVDEQLANISYIQTLAPFNITPRPEDLWSNYRQMTELIIRHTHIPSKAEYRIVKSLAGMYDAYVYNPILVASRRGPTDADVFQSLNELYDITMTLVQRYRSWGLMTRDMKRDHMKPTMTKILSQPAVMEGFSEMEEAKEAAKRVLCDDEALGLGEPDEKALETLEKDALWRRLKASKVKTRYRRERTL